jgi:hypothetical protein
VELITSLARDNKLLVDLSWRQNSVKQMFDHAMMLKREQHKNDRCSVVAVGPGFTAAALSIIVELTDVIPQAEISRQV